jgi:hypothetical protein
VTDDLRIGRGALYWLGMTLLVTLVVVWNG